MTVFTNSRAAGQCGCTPQGVRTPGNCAGQKVLAFCIFVFSVCVGLNANLHQHWLRGDGSKALKQFPSSSSLHGPRNATCEAQARQESQNAKTNGPDHPHEHVLAGQLPHFGNWVVNHFRHLAEVVELVNLKEKAAKQSKCSNFTARNSACCAACCAPTPGCTYTSASTYGGALRPTLQRLFVFKHNFSISSIYKLRNEPVSSQFKQTKAFFSAEKLRTRGGDQRGGAGNRSGPAVDVGDIFVLRIKIKIKIKLF